MPPNPEEKANKLKELLSKPDAPPSEEMLKTSEIMVRRLQEADYEQVEISHKSESPDPRVGGTKIIFDSRFDKITEQSKTADLDAFIKAKQESK